MAVRMLLLQARRLDDPMCEHEHRCFVSRTGLPPGNIVAHNLCEGPPPVARLRRFDALTVGGSGEFYVSEGNLPRFAEMLEFLREAVERDHPTFASCFGFQAIVLALGGELIHDPPTAEVGTFELTLTAEGRADPLFGNMPPRFMAQMGHKDRAATFPAGMLNLATSERCRFQALRLPGKSVWAAQFHPELDRETNLDRFHRYMRDYGPDDPSRVSAAEACFGESAESSSLLTRFLDLVFG